ncbi:MAG: methylcobamide--CoM methyltransferase MtbA, partial [Gammaproteobacteria bacterium]
IAKAGRGGGFILADNHGEIPWQVPEAILLAIGDAVERWGRYPLDWTV